MKDLSHLHRVSALILVVLACAPVAAEPLRFRWPVPSVAVVNAEMEKRGNASTATYRIRVGPGDDGELALEFSEFEFLSLNGADAKDPAVAARLGPLATLTSALPTMRLSASGDYLGTVGLETMMDRVLTTLGDSLDAATVERLSRRFRSPDMQALMQRKSGDLWNVWVGAWNGVDLEPGGTLQGTVPVNVLGRELQQKMLFEHLGDAPQNPCCVHLRLTTILEGPEVVDLLIGMIRELAPPDKRVDPSMFASARSTTMVEVVTDPYRLKPRMAKTLTEIVLEGEGDEKHRRMDHQTYHFQWE